MKNPTLYIVETLDHKSGVVVPDLETAYEIKDGYYNGNDSVIWEFLVQNEDAKLNVWEIYMNNDLV